MRQESGSLSPAQAQQRAKQEKASERRHRKATRVIPGPGNPMAVARGFIADLMVDEGGLLKLRHWRGGWWVWQGPHWIEIEPRAIRDALYRYCEHACFVGEDGLFVAWNPTRHKVDNLLDVLATLCLLPRHTDQPCWLDGRSAGTIVACRNGLLDVGRHELLSHTAAFFNVVSVPFDYDPKARVPRQWLRFLRELWPTDPQSRKALAEWFGYTVSGRTDLQKILLLIGPTRAGKGVISRILKEMVGRKNVCGPTLSSLSGEFGLAPLIGKSLAIVSDARLTGRHGGIVVERLLSISGEDYLTVNIKYQEQWTGKLPTRLFVVSNELPEFGDASGAIVGRFIVLMLSQSWLGREDIELELRLQDDLAGILNWALMGLAKLEQARRFVEPVRSRDAIIQMNEMASPMRVFIRDECEQGRMYSVDRKELYAAYTRWADTNGHPKISSATFGRNLRAVMPGIATAQLGGRGSRHRSYLGLRLRGDDE